MTPRLVHALQFKITPSPGMHSACLVVWPDNPTRKARPVRRNQDWLEVAAGDDMFVAGIRKRVLSPRLPQQPRIRGGTGRQEWMGVEAAAGCGR